MKKSPVRLIAERADRVARGLEVDSYAMMRTFLRHPESYADLVVDLDDADVTQDQFSRAIQTSMTRPEWEILGAINEVSGMTPGEDAIQIRRWSKTRVVYVVDPDMADAITDGTDWSSTVIPGEVLRHLPHPDPMVILPEPVILPNTDGHLEKYEAMLVLGVRGDRRRCSTHHPDVDYITLHFIGHVCDTAGNPLDLETPDMNHPGTIRVIHPIVGMRVVTPLTDMDMEGRQAAAVRDMVAAGPAAMTGFAGFDDARAGMERLTKVGLSLLVYLVTDDSDTGPANKVTPSAKRKKRDARTAEPERLTTVIEVGYRIGAALRAARDGQRDRSASGDGEKRSVSAHVRRAHLHTFRRGKGMQERFVKWLPPIPVAWDKHVEGQTQVHVKRGT